MGLHIKAKLRSFRERQLNRQYMARIAGAKRRISYEEWLDLAGRECLYHSGKTRNGQSSDRRETAPHSLTEQCDAAFCQGPALLQEQGIRLILQKHGYVDPEAFSWIAAYFREHPETLLLYGDEDVLDATGEHRCSPCFRPDWSPDTWLSGFYLGSVIALRRELTEKLPPGMWPGDCEGELYFTDPATVRPLVHHLLELAGGFARGCDAIAHLPAMLFHMNHDAAGSGVGNGCLREDRISWPRRFFREVPCTISVIIPSKDNPQVLEQCLESLRKCQERVNGPEDGTETPLCQMEILVVDNGSSPQNRLEIEKITRGMKYIYEPMPFNFSKMCNRGAREASGEVLLFLNDDITVSADGWLESMAERALRPYVGAVGLKLYYPDSSKIQHVGIASLPGGPVHKLQFTLDGQEEDYGYGSLDRNVIGVTGACLMVQKDRFWQTGGFPEDLQVAYNDVELCFRLREAGWHNVVLNRFHAYHHESFSRGSDLSREKMLRLRQERQKLYQRHPQYLDYDPYYPAPLCMELGDMRIYALYLDTRTEPQTVSRWQRLGECPEQEPENLACALRSLGNSERQALSTRQPRENRSATERGQGQEPEQEEPGLQGYIVVKWDNNAYYNRYLLLRKQGEAEKDVYAVRLEEKYSREAEYGMQEQPNVAMCGFQVTLLQGILPEGVYQIGMQARSRIGRRRLTAWTEYAVRIKNGKFGCFTSKY